MDRPSRPPPAAACPHSRSARGGAMTRLTLTAGIPAVLAAGTVGVGSATAAPAHLVTVTPAAGPAVAGRYIVTVTDGNPRAIAAAAHVTPRYVYDAAMHGFAAALNA